MEGKNRIKSTVEFTQRIKQLQTEVDKIKSMVQTLLEMNKNQQPTQTPQHTEHLN